RSEGETLAAADPPGRPAAEHERGEEEDVVGGDGTEPESPETGGARRRTEQVVRERGGAGRRKEEGEVPELGPDSEETRADLVHPPLEDHPVQPRIARVGGEGGGDAVPRRAEVERGEREKQQQRRNALPAPEHGRTPSPVPDRPGTS